MNDKYEIVRKEYIDDIHSEATLLRHKKSGARIVLLENGDENKVFNIAFRTPPANSTGVAHIIEHTVLCGSRKFPLKDPFIELAKGSLNTFLNAMTYPDKTMYPIASCNDTDFMNLMDVYLDAVFYPNIYREEKIFRQEGWHYELEDRDGELTYNGVVYNEMKGAFSTATDVLDRKIFDSLFPDTPYGVESGGDPEFIPELTYEEFLDFHRKYYHPSNSYITLYGDMDMDEKLEWLDREYLSAFDRISVDSEIAMQEPFQKPVELIVPYPILDSENETENTYLSESFVIGDYRDPVTNIGFSVLKYALLDAPGAPVKQALLDAHIGKDIISTYSDGIIQPFLTITAKNAEEADRDRFLEIIRESLNSLAENGIEKKTLLSGINYFEFRFREADYGSYPKGLLYSIDLFDSWLYDEEDPFEYLREIRVFEELKKKAEEGFFEELIRKYLLDNTHSAIVTLKPQKGLTAEKDAAVAAKLAEYKATLSDEEVEALVKATGELKAYQQEEDTPEAIASLPMLRRSDIDRKSPVKLSTEVRDVDGTTFLMHHYDTNGIAYLTLLFDTKDVPDDMIPYLGELNHALGLMSTENYTYGELFHEINSRTGGIGSGLRITPLADGENMVDDKYRMVSVTAKYLYQEQDFVFDIIREMLTTTDYTDEKRLKELIDSRTSALRNGLQAAGHVAAVDRALSYHTPSNAWMDRVGGVSHYRLLEDIGHDFEGKKDELISKLQELARMVFRPENLTVSINAEEKGFEGAEEQIVRLREGLFKDDVRRGSFEWKAERKNEGFVTSGQVQFVALAGNFMDGGYKYTGAYKILKVLLNYEYMWMQVRVLGGAYGCMSNFRRTGASYFVSYRDPHMKRTFDVFKGIPEYLENFDADEKTMTKFVIGTISEMDTPLTASGKGALSLTCWLTGITDEDLQREREQVLEAQPEDIRALAGPVRTIVEGDNICVIGSETVMERDAEICFSVEPLVPVY
ncbi:MAG: insulinase family protein [Clostridia bacterium]|nr:insulinase family protein [Clostridia bacterium]